MRSVRTLLGRPGTESISHFTGFHQHGEVNGSEFAANNIKRIVTKSGHRITMVDTPGKETISLATPRTTRFMLTEDHEDTGT